MINLFFLISLILMGYHTPQKNQAKSKVLKLHGQVFNSDSNQPVNSMVTITYKTLPYGSDVGINKVNDEYKQYQFYLKRNEKYKIQAHAPGFAATTKRVEDLDLVSGNEILLNLQLEPAKVGKLLNYQNLIFDKGKYHIQKEAKIELEDLTTTMLVNPEMIIQLEGHTDFLGGETQNLKLAQNRVDQVKSHLVQKGIDQKRIKTKALGESNPLLRAGNEDERKVNRRVEIRVMNL